MRIPFSLLFLFVTLSLTILPDSQAQAVTINAASCSRTDVQNAINSAVSGDTVFVPVGICTWLSDINISKSITLAGAGIGKTVITGRANIIDVGTNATVRITGFTFNLGSGGYAQVWSTQGFRIDHNRFIRTNHDFLFLVGGNSGIATEGLFDHNEFVNGSIVFFGEDTSSAGRFRWSQPLELGTQHAIYIEDNVFQFSFISGSFPGAMDGNLGSRTVFRFNTVTNGRVEQHSLQGDNSRAVRMWEIYDNTFTSADWTNYRPFFIRGGTGMVFHNTSDGKYTANVINIDNARSEQESIVGQVTVFGMCDGSSFPDGNTPGQQGWPCRDQIGRSTDASLWNYGSPAPSQASAPAYFWRNIQPGGEIPIERSCEADDARCTRQNTYHLIESRDYYTYRSSFNGTDGIGEGPLANRPSTCTTGVAYWATDQGEWNSSQAGADGQLYKCTATNTWTLYYTPYTYPHPLQGGTPPLDTTPPSAPSGLTVQ